MRTVALVTDSTAGLSPATAAELGIEMVPASFAFAEERHIDGTLPWQTVYQRMRDTGAVPRTFGVAEAAFRATFEQVLERAQSILCLLTPFDVTPSFTTACAAMLAIQFDQPDAPIRVANAGVGPAGLGALLIQLASHARAGASIEELLGAVETLEPRCDSLFVPQDTTWLAKAGRLQMVEDRLGSLDGRIPVVRVGTRITGVASAEDWAGSLRSAVLKAGARSEGDPIVVSIVHADAPYQAEDLARQMRTKWPVVRLEMTELSGTHGAILGPGTVGVGVCPSRAGGE